MPNVVKHCLLALAAGMAGTVGVAADAPAPPASTTPATEPVESIVVTAKKLTVETLIDRTVYSVAADVQSAFGSVSDVLTAIPSVDVSPDGNLSLRGDAGVLVLVDGKPSARFSGAAAAENLQSMAASEIERIEVITTPPAEFKAEGVAGIINIVTRRKRQQGLEGSAQASLGNDGRANVAASVSDGRGPLVLSASAGVRHGYRERELASIERQVDPASGQLLTSTSTLVERLHRQIPTASASADYAIDAHQSLNASINWSKRGGLRTYTQSNLTTTPTGVATHSDGRSSWGHDPETDADARLAYTRKLARAGEELELSAHRSVSHQQEHYDYTNDSAIPALPRSYSSLAFREDHVTQELEAGYTLPLSRTRTLKAGYGYTGDDYGFANSGYTLDPVDLLPVPDPNTTNDFRYHQQVHSAYASYQSSRGPWTWLPGLRLEDTRTLGRQLTDQVQTPGHYFGAFPSLHVSRAVSEHGTWSFGASRRISRPDPQDLNPYVSREYTPNLNAGNARLRPQYTQSYEFGYGHEDPRTSWQLTGYYRRNRDSVTDVTVYQGNGFELTTKANLPRNDAAGLEVTAGGHLLPKLAYSLSGNLFHSQIDATPLGLPGLQSTSGVNGKLKLDFRPTAGDSAQLTLTRTDRRLTPQGYISATNIVNAGLRHQVDAALTAVATVSDLFNGQRFERIANTATVASDFLRRVQGRIFFIGATYTFGANRKDKAQGFDFDKGD